MIERLPFQLPDFTRIMWVSDRARTAWLPRVARIGRAWTAIERRAVLAGLRACALQHVAVSELPAFAAECARDDLSALPLALEGQPGGTYATEAAPARADVPTAFRVVIGSSDAALRFKVAWDRGDQSEIGRLLGYPACCSRFFQRVWVDERSLDTTWAMALGTRAPAAPRIVDVDGPPEANILLRWLGVRAVPHLPCSFHCRDTVRLAAGLRQVARESGFAPEADWINEMLSWPAEWSALHGIAEIKTPVVKVATRTDATAGKYLVRRAGESYPNEGARGTAFPYLQSWSREARSGLTMAAESAQAESPQSGTARHSAPQRLVLRRHHEDWYATDNGFASEASMAVAHRPIVELVTEHFAGRAGTALDIGCGNGALLAAMCARNPQLLPRGVDVDPRKIEHARRLLPRFADRFHEGDMFDTAGRWMDGPLDLAILMPGRLLEADASVAEGLRVSLRSTGAALLVYAYDDWITKYGSLEGLCARAGLRIWSVAGTGPGKGPGKGTALAHVIAG